MNIKPIDASYVFCKILLNFPKDYIFITDNLDIVEILKLNSNKPPYSNFLGKIPFQRKDGRISCQAIENTIEEMKGFMLIPDSTIPYKFTINKKEVLDFVSKFSSINIKIDEVFIKKLAKEIEKKNNSKWEYNKLKNITSKNIF